MSAVQPNPHKTPSKTPPTNPFWGQFFHSIIHPYQTPQQYAPKFGVRSLLIYLLVYAITIIDMITHTIVGIVKWILDNLTNLSQHQIHHILMRPKTYTVINQTAIWPNLVIILLLTPAIIAMVMVLSQYGSQGNIKANTILNQFMQRLNLSNLINVIALGLMEMHLSLVGLILVLCFTFPWNVVTVITTLSHNANTYQNRFGLILIIALIGSFGIQSGLWKISGSLADQASNKIRLQDELKTPQGNFDNNILDKNHDKTVPRKNEPITPTPHHQKTHENDA